MPGSHFSASGVAKHARIMFVRQHCLAPTLPGSLFLLLGQPCHHNHVQHLEWPSILGSHFSASGVAKHARAVLNFCISACLHCMPAVLHFCMSAYLHVCMPASLHFCMSACLHACNFACLHVCIHARIYARYYISSFFFYKPQRTVRLASEQQAFMRVLFNFKQDGWRVFQQLLLFCIEGKKSLFELSVRVLSLHW